MLKISEVKNLFNQLLKFPRLLIIIQKLKNRIRSYFFSSNNTKNIEWMDSNLTDISFFANSIDRNLWNESLAISFEIESLAKERLRNIPFDLGGGGIYPLLYFLTRKRKAEVIVETGVASGYSSSAFLKAIVKNSIGKLYSSDFPYFRLKNPEKYIGILVEDELKKNWNLYIEGDSNNLKKIVSQFKEEGIKKIDIFHYDSDKTYSGREKALSILQEYLKKDSIIIFDDIQDNNFFYDYINKQEIDSWKIFKFKGKYIGLVSDIVVE